MNSEMQLALTLLFVGMITVFLILALVVITGRVLIGVVNKYFSEEEKLTYDYRVPFIDDEVISKKKLAAITAAVEIVTQGKGKIVKIEQR